MATWLKVPDGYTVSMVPVFHFDIPREQGHQEKPWLGIESLKAEETVKFEVISAADVKGLYESVLKSILAHEAYLTLNVAISLLAMQLRNPDDMSDRFCLANSNIGTKQIAGITSSIVTDQKADVDGGEVAAGPVESECLSKWIDKTKEVDVFNSTCRKDLAAIDRIVEEHLSQFEEMDPTMATQCIAAWSLFMMRSAYKSPESMNHMYAHRVLQGAVSMLSLPKTYRMIPLGMEDFKHLASFVCWEPMAARSVLVNYLLVKCDPHDPRHEAWKNRMSYLDFAIGYSAKNRGFLVFDLMNDVCKKLKTTPRVFATDWNCHELSQSFKDLESLNENPYVKIADDEPDKPNSDVSWRWSRAVNDAYFTKMASRRHPALIYLLNKILTLQGGRKRDPGTLVDIASRSNNQGEWIDRKLLDELAQAVLEKEPGF